METKHEVQMTMRIKSTGWRCLVCLPVVLMLLGSLTVAASVDADDSPAVCITVDVSANAPSTVVFVDGFESGGTTPWLDSARAFSATEILDVVFEASVVGEFVGDALLELKVYTPNGHLYQVLTAPVTSKTGKGAYQVRVAGFPYPLAIQHLRASPGSKSSSPGVVLSLPVGGTLIVSTSLYGLWEVRPFLDGESAGCGAPIFFYLVQ
jgi:hypothetical protein